jgi:Ca2+-transporting ATPase
MLNDHSPIPHQVPTFLRTGLSQVDAAVRLKTEGFNELPQADRRTPFRIALEVLREPMLALLLLGGLIYLALGDVHEALILLVFAVLSVVITVVQESRTERVLEALRDLTSPRALVIRDGERRRIAGREVVRGDVIVLAEGDRVPADALIRESHDVQTDESLLTGESVPVRKAPLAHNQSSPDCRPGGDDLPWVFSGSLIVRGSGIAEVVTTGPRTEIGKIGQSLKAVEVEPPRLRAQIQRVVRIFGLCGAGISVVVVVLYGLTRGGWLDAILAGIAIGMSMLPEEFPVVLTVFMAMGAWRISRARVLTRRAAAIETLGSATVLCTDKTGTMTLNRMTIAELRLANGQNYRPTTDLGVGVPEVFLPLLDTGIRGSAIDPHDPMERALHELGQRHAEASGVPRAAPGALVQAYGLRPELLAMSNAWAEEGGAGALIATKGAPEAIADLCHLSPEQRAAALKNVEAMAADGMRVLGVARARFDEGTWPQSQHDFTFEYLGLLGLADPLRPGVADAVAECRSAGIRVVMITGDYPATARAIAAEAGLETAHIVTGDDLERLDPTQLRERVCEATVFARVMPQQKLKIVEALKAAGEIVAMTGDGVNDAPSLKAAHIGIAMGGRGTDVAREASSIVLLDDDFGSIVKAIRLGRRIYDNMRKAMGFIFAVHVPIAGLAVAPLVAGASLLLGPIHIAFLEMIIDPVCSLVFEAETEEDDLMRRPPRAPAEPLFTGRMVAWGLLQGCLSLGVVLAIFFRARANGLTPEEVRALSFFSLVLSIVGLIFVNRSLSPSLVRAFARPNPALFLVLGTVAAVLVASLLWPFLRQLFNFGPLHTDDLGITIAAGALVMLVLEGLKFCFPRKSGARPAAD